MWGIFQRKSIRNGISASEEKFEKKRGRSRAQIFEQAGCERVGKRVRGKFVVWAETPKQKGKNGVQRGSCLGRKKRQTFCRRKKALVQSVSVNKNKKESYRGIIPLRLLFRCPLWCYHAYLLISSSVMPGCSAMLMLLAMIFARRSTTASTSFGVTNRLPVYGPRISVII